MIANKAVNKVDDSYQKYILTIVVDNELYFVVWGSDTSGDGSDKFLVKKSKKIVTFLDISDIKKYILSDEEPLFDCCNIREWAMSHSKVNILSKDVYNLTLMLNLLNTDAFADFANNKKDATHLANFIGIISDYAYQVNDQYLLNLYHKSTLNTFMEYIYSNYLWTPSEEEKSDHQMEYWTVEYTNFKIEIFSYIEYFKSCLSLS